jgi:two-component system nitrate/nitrite sensor histidine kinase NarX
MLGVDQTGEALGQLERMQTAIGAAYGQVRSALVGLREPAAEVSSGQSLADRLAASITEFREATGLIAELTIDDTAALRLPAVTQVQALHIVRESLANVRRHAHARKVRVGVERQNGEARFTVQDDGGGFDPHMVEGDNHLGLAIMRTRAERSGGRLIVVSAPGAGTTVTAAFPLARDEGRRTEDGG